MSGIDVNVFSTITPYNGGVALFCARWDAREYRETDEYERMR